MLKKSADVVWWACEQTPWNNGDDQYIGRFRWEVHIGWWWGGKLIKIHQQKKEEKEKTWLFIHLLRYS